MIKNTGTVQVPLPSSGTNSVAVQEIRDIRPVVHVADDWFWLPWVSALLLCIVVGLKFKQLLQDLPEKKDKTPRLSPERKAHQEMDAALHHLLEPKRVCSILSDALRYFLEERFRFRAPERTTEEFLNELQLSPRLNDEQKKILANFLERCDLVKFARHEPMEAELRELHSVAHHMVDELSLAPAAAQLIQQNQAEENVVLESPELVNRSKIINAIAGVFSFALGVFMWIWPAEHLIGRSDGTKRWLILSRLLDLVWSKPLGTVLIILGVVCIVAAGIRRARRVES